MTVMSPDGKRENQTLALATSDTYPHVIGVDVIRAHHVGIGVSQDDPGVVDFEDERREDKRESH